jgi:predicted transglutaminase-like cysteine proteinase
MPRASRRAVESVREMLAEDAKTMPATPEQLEQLQTVNDEVNAIPYDATPRFGEDAGIWKDAPDDGLWVCRCYVLDKAKKLQELDWPPLSMTVVECWTEPEGDPPERTYHAVLAVETGDATMILDSRVPQVYEWDQCPYDYRWDRRQVAGTTEFESIA